MTDMDGPDFDKEFTGTFSGWSKPDANEGDYKLIDQRLHKFVDGIWCSITITDGVEVVNKLTEDEAIRKHVAEKSDKKLTSDMFEKFEDSSTDYRKHYYADMNRKLVLPSNGMDTHEAQFLDMLKSSRFTVNNVEIDNDITAWGKATVKHRYEITVYAQY